MKDKCISIIQKQTIRKIYHLKTKILQNVDANLKRLSWNDFGELHRILRPALGHWSSVLVFRYAYLDCFSFRFSAPLVYIHSEVLYGKDDEED